MLAKKDTKNRRQPKRFFETENDGMTKMIVSCFGQLFIVHFVQGNFVIFMLSSKNVWVLFSDHFYQPLNSQKYDIQKNVIPKKTMGKDGYGPY